MQDKIYLYEHFAKVSEDKVSLIKENKDLKNQLDDYHSVIFEDFCEFVKVLLDNIDLDKDIKEGAFGGKTDEERMAKYFIKMIKEKSRENGLNAKDIAMLIASKLKGM